MVGRKELILLFSTTTTANTDLIVLHMNSMFVEIKDKFAGLLRHLFAFRE